MENLFSRQESLDKSQLLVDLFDAYYAARKNKRAKESQLAFEWEYESRLIALRDNITNRVYEPLPSIAFVNKKPVLREVFAASFRDRVIHHLIFNHINPVFESLFIEDSYSCRKGKGTLYGVKRVYGFIESCSQGYTKPCYILKLDIKGYFYNINKQKLHDMIMETLKTHRGSLEMDFDTLEYLIGKTIFNNPLKNVQKIGGKEEWSILPRDKSLFFTQEGKGLPIGNLTSQLFSNIYMNVFDQYVKKKLGFEYYGRYVDDFIIVHEDKKLLLDAMQKMKQFLKNELGLTIHPKKIYLQSYQRGVKFLGSYIKPNVMYIERRTKGAFYKLVHRINKTFYDNRDNMEYHKTIRAQINSYLGTMSHYSSFKLRKKILSSLCADFFVCFGVDTNYTRVVLGCKEGYAYGKLLSSSRL